MTKSTPAMKKVVIGEKRLRDEVSNIPLNESKSKEKEALPTPVAKKAKLTTSSVSVTRGTKPTVAPREGISANLGAFLGPGASMLGNPSMVEKILLGVNLLADKEKVDKLSLDLVVTKFFHIVGQLEGLLDEFNKQEKKAVARLEEEVAELKKNKALAKKKFVEEQLAYHHPNLDIDLDGMALDHDLLDEEEEEDEAEEEGGDKEKEGNKGRARRKAMPVYSLLKHLYFCKYLFFL
ncbi:hypothetical protein Acr_05g0009480 [Actinidia rufa]|uniref:Uncharacterized protein n=1 Tax=Actinidia rufa TaxID=165716 RepID=A0A7J0EMV0_9ERIC|nr:hypothetical protein Acr_05g0009480 [Actinidia rufa]